MDQLVNVEDEQDRPVKFSLRAKNIPDIDDTERARGEGEEIMRHVLTECSQFRELRRTMWADEVRKARYHWIDLRTILTNTGLQKESDRIHAENRPPWAISG